VDRYVDPKEFDALKEEAEQMFFSSVASAPMVRSSNHADIQAHEAQN
jgi:lipoic acid synthetase